MRSNTHPYADPDSRVEHWLEENLFQVQEVGFFSHSSLQARLLLSEVPVYEEVPSALTASLGVVFGDLIGLAGVEVGQAYTDDLAQPVTIYWQAAQPITDHYKYVLKLVEVAEDGTPVADLAVTEREPYDGAIPTIYWGPGQTIVEYTELPPTEWPQPGSAELGRYRLALQVYRADTLEKLPVTHAADEGVTVAADGQTLLLPYLPTEGRP